MNTALRIVLLFNSFFVILACGEAPQPKSSEASSSPLATSPIAKTADSTILQKLPLLSGAFKGIGADQGRSFSWAVANNQLEGIYLGKKKVEEDYTKRFRFRVENGVICCFPGDYGGKCDTPDGTYRLAEQTDSSYTFLADHHPLNKTVSTLKFSFAWPNRMNFEWKHEYADSDYPDYHIVRHFQKSL